MKKVLGCLLLLGVILTGCFKKKDDCTAVTTVVPESEKTALKTYLDTNRIQALEHSSGMYYEIIDNGTDKSPDRCSSVHVSYIGQLPTGQVFESNNNIYLKLSVLIDGWRLGLPLIKKGGRIKMYIPPSLGYGNAGKYEGNTVIIPPNSILIYDVTLVDL